MFDYQRVIPFFEVSKLYKELSSCTPSATAADKTGSRGSLLACATVKLCIACFFPTHCGSSCGAFEVDSCWADPVYQKIYTRRWPTVSKNTFRCCFGLCHTLIFGPFPVSTRNRPSSLARLMARTPHSSWPQDKEHVWLADAVSSLKHIPFKTCFPLATRPSDNILYDTK